VVIASTGAACAELDGNAKSRRLSGALAAGEAGETILVESVARELRGIAAIIDPPLVLGSSAICTNIPLAPAIDPNTMKARASPTLRRKLGDRQK